MDLDPHRTLFVELNHNVQPVSELQLQGNRLFLLPAAAPTKPLTLEQFDARTQALAGQVDLFQSIEQPQRLYGYRLHNNQIIFG
ncbi:hypothetical protein [Fructilactobacillus carniphilus]|uniref:Uncharacterized protein n=1 Tax=Fructilactobacillus carniphilus TaxID=2940297 RepID=A0ABY5BYN4_9LACO|nr:hypothetical protein [Fructilactobacillus carniphilus]USS90945.1 hypothetical protein M3M37_01685 [Fructilactobacillus carniphilus]